MLYALLVEGMSVVVNVMLYLMSVMSPPPALCKLMACTVVKLCGPPASFSVHLASSAVTLAGSVHKSRGDHVVRMWVQLKR